MTYREHAKILNDNVAKKYSELVKVDTQLIQEGNGFIDQALIEKRFKAYNAWQIAQNEFSNLMTFIIRLKVNLDEQFTTIEEINKN